ncbi:MAG TPA: hypothetical protein VG938_13845 [Verrucomicrobiae bacterium]|nr:hypothetical protein [Verrucomicrobiae bacterium]
MRAQKVLARDFQFYFSDLDNIVLVECREDESVIIRATKNNVSDQRKTSFIRKLAAEGFIPDQYQWFSGSTGGSDGVLWIKDYSWLAAHRPSRKSANRFVGRLVAAASVLLICMMRVLVVSHHSPATVAQKTSPVIAASGAPIALQPRPESLVPGNPLPELQRQH